MTKSFIHSAILTLCGAFAIGILLTGVPSRSAVSAPVVAPELPALPASAWLNSTPLTLASLRGKPVLVEFWTFDCSNCRATLPWMKRVADRYAPQGLTVIAVHSPELEHERDPSAVAAHVRQLGIDYPVLIDNDFRYWNALGNQFWPAFYLIDGQGRVVATRIGELHTGERSADDFERAIGGTL
ncbi:MAG TPA: redoxin family protein [Steroidobacteraceae bacterium]